MNTKVSILTNIPSPYRVDLFNYLINNYNKYEFKIFYSATEEDDRGWDSVIDKIKNSVFLNSKTIKINSKLDGKHIHIPTDIIKNLEHENPDIVIGSEYNPTTILAFLWCKFKRKKFISWSDGTLNSEKSINFIQKLLRKVICNNSDAFIASSSKTKEAQSYYGADKGKIFLSYLTVDIEKYLYKREKNVGNRILFVGRLSKIKGIDILLNELKNIKSDYFFTIVGDGPEKENLIKLSKKLGIDKNVKFIGSKNGNDLKQQYRENDIFILPTRCDCYGLVLVEAMCNSMAIISSKYADGAYDLIENGENGYIVDIYNKDISEKLQLLLNDNDLVNKMGKKSYELANKFTLENVSINFVKAIEYVKNMD